MSDAQLACLALLAGPFVVSAAFVLFDLCANAATLGPAPSSARVTRLTFGGPVFAALWIIGVLAEAIETVVGFAAEQAERAVLRLRDWMDV